MRLARVSTPLPVYAAARFLKFTEDCRGNTPARQLYIRKLRARCINRASASPGVFNKFCSPGIRFRTMLHEYSISIGTSKLRANERNVDRNKFIIAQGGTSRGGGPINSRAAMAKNFRIDQIVSIQNIATRYLFLRDIYFFFLFPPFFSFFPPPSPLPFFIIRFSCHEVRIKKHRKRFSFARELAMVCVHISNVYPGNERNFDVCYLHLLCYFIAGSPVNTYLSPIFKYLPTRWHFSTVEERLQLISGTIHRDKG